MFGKSINGSSFLESISTRHDIERHRQKYNFMMQSANKVEREKFGSPKRRTKTYKHSRKKNSIKSQQVVPTRKRKSTKIGRRSETNRPASFDKRQIPLKTNQNEYDIITVASYNIPAQTDSIEKSICVQRHEVNQNGAIDDKDLMDVEAKEAEKIDLLSKLKGYALDVLKDKNLTNEKKMEIIDLLKTWRSEVENPLHQTKFLSEYSLCSNGQKAKESENIKEDKKKISGNRDFQYLQTGTLLKVIEDSKELSSRNCIF